MKKLEHLIEVPWSRYEWTGDFISHDGTPTDDFTRGDIDALLCCFEDERPAWDGESAGIVRLKDGRFVSWESWWDATGSGFCHDAYGGNAGIFFARTLAAATHNISEKARERLEWAP